VNALSHAPGPGAARLTIGLVNNMPDAARRATDEQFTALLLGASPGLHVHIRRFAPTPAAGHAPIETLWRTCLDGLIVTGAEPRADRLDDEPSWPLLARLVDWATEHTDMAIFSCLAAHAAAYRLDGVARRRLSKKLSGLLTCTAPSPHPLLDGTPASWAVPHSRCNDLDAGDLARAGYTIIAHCDAGSGIDCFERSAGRSRFLMLQGHPEYAADTLLREYRRDIRRYLGGDRADWPQPPRAYLDPATEAELARHTRSAAALTVLDAAPVPAAHWQPHAIRLFGAWLAHLSAATQPTTLSSP